MNIIYVQSTPTYFGYAKYHSGTGKASANDLPDMPDNSAFLSIINRDKWMPAMTTQRGYPSELWAVGHKAEETNWQYDILPSLKIRIFESDQTGLNSDEPSQTGNGKTAGGQTAKSRFPFGLFSGVGKDDDPSKYHTSSALIEAARNAEADLFVLNGLDGGVGVHLARELLIPNRIPFAVILKGELYHPILKHAISVLYENGHQRQQLTQRSIRFWRPVTEEEKLIRLSKSVDTRHYVPDEKIPKEVDLICIGRPLDDPSDFSAIFELSRHLKVAVIGDGPLLEGFRQKYPEITWYGDVPYADIPSVLNSGKLFFYSRVKESSPTSIAEAAACGVPPVGFIGAIPEDLISEAFGLRVSRKKYLEEIRDLLGQPDYLKRLSKAAREHAETHWHHRSSQHAIRKLILQIRAVR